MPFARAPLRRAHGVFGEDPGVARGQCRVLSRVRDVVTPRISRLCMHAVRGWKVKKSRLLIISFVHVSNMLQEILFAAPNFVKTELYERVACTITLENHSQYVGCS